MDGRRALEKGRTLEFPGMSLRIEEFIGMGSNAVVYKGSYEDGLNAGMRHTVLVKELFPFESKGQIYRNDRGEIVVEKEAEETYLLHKKSFERGNEAHLKLLEAHPDLIGGNINTAQINGTMYTVLAESGGRDFRTSDKPASLKIAVRRILSILDALEAFHGMSLMHLDISPDNILLIGTGENERAMLIDYNSVFSMEELSRGDGEYFSVKAGYTSPEVVNKSMESISFASDLYSVTAVFYAMLAGEPLTLPQMLSKNPPDVSSRPLVEEMPETVKSYLRSIFKKGLNALATRRYKSIGEMRKSLLELMNRIDMLGITHSSLWEAGRRAVQTLVKTNPFYRFLSEDEKMFPVRLQTGETETMDMKEYLSEFISESGASTLCVSPGGMGKTTLLLKGALNLSKDYAANRPAQLYVSLAGRAAQKKDLILDAILENLRFTPDTVTYDGARHQLKALLATTLKSKMGDAPVLVLLLDGLNEVQGDTGYLLEEIGALSRLAGVRILITSRAEEKRLPFREISVSPLKDEDIEKALSAKGLLIPENPEIRQLLNTPLMLSIFIEASGSENQLRVEKEEELLEAYVKALLKKEMDALSDDEAEKYRIEAAVTYVLPALSDAMKKAGALTDAEMYAVCEKCRKTLQSGILVRAFPGFLGHRKEIALESADEFFGKMVHGILWHRMGLILRAENLSRISHARIGEYLSEIHSANVKRIKRRMLIKNALICAAGAAVLGALAAAYFTWGRYLTLDTTPPRPTYDDEQMELYLDYAIAGYSNYGKAYEHMIELLDYCDKGDKVNFDYWYPKRRDIIERYTDDIRSRNTMIDRVQKLLNSEGEVCSWSGQEVEDEYALALINLQKTCSIEYLREMDILAFWMKNEKVQKDYPNYPGLLRELVEADAWMSAQMYQLVYVPHQEGCNEAAHDRRLENIKEMGEIDQRRIMVSGEEARTKLKTAESERDDALNEVKTISNQIALDMNKD